MTWASKAAHLPLERAKAGEGQIYPHEAFAFAIVLLTATFRQALLAGVLIVFATTLAMWLKGLLEGCSVPRWSACASAAIIAGSVNYAAQRLAFAYAAPGEYNWQAVLVASLLCAKFAACSGGASMGGALCGGARAYACMAVAGLSREYMAQGSVFGYQLVKPVFGSRYFQSALMGLLLAGFALAIVNAAGKTSPSRASALLAIVPVLLIEPPLTFDSALLSALLGAGLALLLFYSAFRALRLSEPPEEFRGAPLALITTSIIYVVLHGF